MTSSSRPSWPVTRLTPALVAELRTDIAAGAFQARSTPGTPAEARPRPAPLIPPTPRTGPHPAIGQQPADVADTHLARIIPAPVVALDASETIPFMASPVAGIRRLELTELLGNIQQHVDEIPQCKLDGGGGEALHAALLGALGLSERLLAGHGEHADSAGAMLDRALALLDSEA